jgi:quercetin dioxygenase-like cupin family protein
MEVISRSDIAPLNSVVVDGALHELGVVKIFSHHPALAQFIPSKSELALSWVRLEKDQELSVHQHPEASLILICDGSGKTLGDTEQNIEAGDMVLVSPHSLHGLKAPTMVSGHSPSSSTVRPCTRTTFNRTSSSRLKKQSMPNLPMCC